jgi:hypothetical protein
MSRTRYGIEIRFRGSRCYFPVFVKGANLSVGDLHFSQGDVSIFSSFPKTTTDLGQGEVIYSFMLLEFPD